MSKIILFGGHGHVARLLTPMLVQAGHSVTSVIRNPEQVPAIAELGGNAVVSSIEDLDIAGFATLIEGHDAIVWSAGAGGGNPARTAAIDRDAAIYSMQAARLAGVHRYLMVSWSASQIDHPIPQSEPFFHYAQAKMIADAVLRDSGLDYTIIAPGTLTHDPATGRIGDAVRPGSVPRADVAATTLAALENPASIGRSYRFTSGAETIADYVADPAHADTPHP